MKNWLFLLCAIVGEVVATSALKSSDGFSKLGPSVVTVLAYGVAFYFLSLTLRSIPVGIAYAIWAGLGMVLIAAVGWVMHGQRLDGGDGRHGPHPFRGRRYQCPVQDERPLNSQSTRGSNSLAAGTRTYC